MKEKYKGTKEFMRLVKTGLKKKYAPAKVTNGTLGELVGMKPSTANCMGHHWRKGHARIKDILAITTLCEASGVSLTDAITILKKDVADV